MMSLSLPACFCSNSDERYTIGRVRQLFWKHINKIQLLEVQITASFPALTHGPWSKTSHKTGKTEHVHDSLPGQVSSQHSRTSQHSCPSVKGSGDQTFSYKQTHLRLKGEQRSSGASWITSGPQDNSSLTFPLIGHCGRSHLPFTISTSLLL